MRLSQISHQGRWSQEYLCRCTAELAELLTASCRLPILLLEFFTAYDISVSWSLMLNLKWSMRQDGKIYNQASCLE